MDTVPQIIEIEPIKETVSTHTVKVQVSLDEDATNQEILRALDHTCKEWSGALAAGEKLEVLVGKLLLAVSRREIYADSEWGTLEAFVEKEVTIRHGISRSKAFDCMLIAENLPGVTGKQVKSVGSEKLLLVARAVKAAPREQKSRLRTKLLRQCETRSTDEFRAALRGRNLIRTRSSERKIQLVTISFQVPVELAEEWRRFVGSRSQAMALRELMDRRKGAQRAGHAKTA